MEALFTFIAKSSGLLVLFYFAYFFLLRKETFFNSNRWFLLAGLITSLVLPFVVYTKIVWVDPTPMPAMNYSTSYVPHNIMNTIPEESFEINWNYIALAIYGIGFLALIIKFATDFYSLNSVLKGREIQQEADFKFIDIEENIAPFSYFDYIVPCGIRDKAVTSMEKELGEKVDFDLVKKVLVEKFSEVFEVDIMSGE